MPTFKINFTRVDNWVNVYINDLCVFTDGHATRLPKPTSLDISRYLVKGDNTVRVEGVNYAPWSSANPFFFDYTITQDNQVISTVSQRSNRAIPTPGSSYVAASSSLRIVV